ncbi:hypothetical protein [Clostridium magnum]|uniref:Uncharacterized protein n=1 Tax=Clostridium magnum DSM 2767 TaxID=1121326 RepID=A0A161X3A4_9CLOT|nr:hypothetical protein [Clostridium magnum]KZL93948.1 hypothetical protein CLMAG_10010 [Clostridium magnum DSM 2767]SHH99147.1 hypothetical protein SAMN02745944_02025 [Clostridium magnum DSM 2767]
MESIIEDILKDEFVEYSKVYESAKIKGMSKKEVREVKQRIGVKTICVANGEERIWLWYIPKNIWNRYSQKK